jgi:hypothetical protein
MTKDQKITRAKAGLLELAKQLGNVSQACKIMGYSRDRFYRFKVRIPRQSGRGFRFDVGHRSDLIPATIPK